MKSATAILAALLGACSTLPKGTHGYHQLGITLFLPADASAKLVRDSDGEPKSIVVTRDARTVLTVERTDHVDIPAHVGAQNSRLEISGFDGPAARSTTPDGGEAFEGHVIVRKLSGDFVYRFTYSDSAEDAAVARWILKEAMLDDRPAP